MSETEPNVEVSRLKLTLDDLEQLSKEELIIRWNEQDHYIDYLEDKQATVPEKKDEPNQQEIIEKLRTQLLEAARKESVLVMRLTTKEQEHQDLLNQINELKASQTPGISSLRSHLMDPAVNLVSCRLKRDLDDLKRRLEETQNELNAWKFTPDSNTGKRLMAKCRLLYQENEELGKMVSAGRVAKLEGDLALQKNFSAELKKSQSELEEFLSELDEDVEGLQSTIYYLQKQLQETKDQVEQLIHDNEALRRTQSTQPAAANIEELTNGPIAIDPDESIEQGEMLEPEDIPKEVEIQENNNIDEGEDEVQTQESASEGHGEEVEELEEEVQVEEEEEEETRAESSQAIEADDATMDSEEGTQSELVSSSRDQSSHAAACVEYDLEYSQLDTEQPDSSGLKNHHHSNNAACYGMRTRSARKRQSNNQDFSVSSSNNGHNSSNSNKRLVDGPLPPRTSKRLRYAQDETNQEPDEGQSSSLASLTNGLTQDSGSIDE